MLVPTAGDITLGSYGSGDAAGKFTVDKAFGGDIARGVYAFTEKKSILLEAKGVGTTTIGNHKIEVLAAPMFELVFLNDSDGIVKAGTPVRVGIRTRAVVRGLGWPTEHITADISDSAKINWKFGTAAGSFGHWMVELSVPSSGLSFAESTDRFDDKWSAHTSFKPNLNDGFEDSKLRYKLELPDSGPSTTTYNNFNMYTDRAWYLLTDGAQPRRLHDYREGAEV